MATTFLLLAMFAIMSNVSAADNNVSSTNTSAQIQSTIDLMSNGDTLNFNNDGIYQNKH